MNKWGICWVLFNEGTLSISVAHGGAVGEGWSTQNKIHQPLATLTVDVKRINPLLVLAFSWNLLTVTEKWNMTKLILEGVKDQKLFEFVPLKIKCDKSILSCHCFPERTKAFPFLMFAVLIGPRCYVHVLLQEGKPKILV